MVEEPPEKKAKLNLEEEAEAQRKIKEDATKEAAQAEDAASKETGGPHFVDAAISRVGVGPCKGRPKGELNRVGVPIANCDWEATVLPYYGDMDADEAKAIGPIGHHIPSVDLTFARDHI